MSNPEFIKDAAKLLKRLHSVHREAKQLTEEELRLENGIWFQEKSVNFLQFKAEFGLAEARRYSAKPAKRSARSATHR